MFRFRFFSDYDLYRQLRLAAPMSYILEVVMALMRGSILAAVITNETLPWIPTAPILLLPANACLPK